MKKNSLIILSFLGLFVGILVYSNYINAENTIAPNEGIKKMTFHAKSDGFYTFNELENKTSIIVKGIKNEEINTNIFKSEIDDEILGGYVSSEFKITQVYKNNDGNKKIFEGNIIPILEHAFYDIETDINYNVNGYQKMQYNKEYLLFLLPEEEEIFAIQGVNFGKVPLNTDDIEINLDDSLLQEQEDVFNQIFKNAKRKYNK